MIIGRLKSLLALLACSSVTAFIALAFASTSACGEVFVGAAVDGGPDAQADAGPSALDATTAADVTTTDSAQLDSSTIDAADAADAEAGPNNPCLVAGSAPNVIADSVAGFRGVQGECGWRYGYFDNNGAVAFADFPTYSAGIWSLNQSVYTHLTAQGGSPHDNQWASRRWNVSVTGTVRFVGNIWLTDPGQPISGNGIVFRIRMGTDEIYSVTLGNNQSSPLPFDKQQAVVAGGAPVDFIIDSYQSNAFYDSTAFNVKIIFVQ